MSPARTCTSPCPSSSPSSYSKQGPSPSTSKLFMLSPSPTPAPSCPPSPLAQPSPGLLSPLHCRRETSQMLGLSPSELVIWANWSIDKKFGLLKLNEFIWDLANTVVEIMTKKAFFSSPFFNMPNPKLLYATRCRNVDWQIVFGQKLQLKHNNNTSSYVSIPKLVIHIITREVSVDFFYFLFFF